MGEWTSLASKRGKLLQAPSINLSAQTEQLSIKPTNSPPPHPDPPNQQQQRSQHHQRLSRDHQAPLMSETSQRPDHSTKKDAAKRSVVSTPGTKSATRHSRSLRAIPATQRPFLPCMENCRALTDGMSKCTTTSPHCHSHRACRTCKVTVPPLPAPLLTAPWGVGHTGGGGRGRAGGRGRGEDGLAGVRLQHFVSRQGWVV